MHHHVIGMLQFNRLQSAAETNIPQQESSSPSEVVTTFVQLVHRQFPVILLVSFLTTMLGIVYVLITPPRYTANATMIIDTKPYTIFQQGANVGNINVESPIVSSQVEILKSEKIALAVINEFKL